MYENTFEEFDFSKYRGVENMTFGSLCFNTKYTNITGRLHYLNLRDSLGSGLQHSNNRDLQTLRLKKAKALCRTHSPSPSNKWPG